MKKYLEDDLGRIFAHTECAHNRAGLVEFGSDLEDCFFIEGQATIVPPSKLNRDEKLHADDRYFDVR